MASEEIVRKTRYTRKLKTEEMSKMVQLSKIVKKWKGYSQSTICKEYLDNPMNLWRYMRPFMKEKNGVQDCAKIILKTARWRGVFKPHLTYKKAQFLNYIKKGGYENLDICFVSGYCKKGHPVAYLFANREKDITPRDGKRMDFFFDLVCFLVEDCVERKLKGGYQFTLVVDASTIGLSHWTLVSPFLKKFNAFSDYYFERLYKAVVVNTKSWIMGMWKFCSPFLYSTTVAKYNFCKGTSLLKEFIDERQIPARLGGKKKVKYSLGEHVDFVMGLKNRIPKVEEDENEEDEVDGEDEETCGMPNLLMTNVDNNVDIIDVSIEFSK